MFRSAEKFIVLAGGLWLFTSPLLFSQERSFWEPTDSFHHRRFWISAGTGAGMYTGTMIGLHYAWYANVERRSFHTFDDWSEWQNIDKYGHIITAYHESRWITQGALWTGIPHRQAVWLGTGTAFLLQGSIEMLDAFAAKWGFSWWDMAANTAGCAIFAAQELSWRDQRISIKISSAFPHYDDTPFPSADGMHFTSLKKRAEALFGIHPAERFLKDYNAQTYWLSVNPSSFLTQRPDWLPPWLNIAAGLRGHNMYAGYGYAWTDEETGAVFELDPVQYPRRMRYFLSLDVDFTRLPVRHPFWKSVCHAFNFIKVPFPTLEWQSNGQIRGHWLYF